MAELDAALVGATAPGRYGGAEAGLSLREVVIRTAWNVQGDPAAPAFCSQAEKLFGLSLPMIPNTIAHGQAWMAVWIGRKSWLVLGTDPSLRPPQGELELGVARERLNDCGGALFDVSASRVGFALDGSAAAIVLNKSCPLDLRSSAFAPGTCAQSTLGHIGVLLIKHEEVPTFTVIVARSLRADAWRTLCLSAADNGYVVAAPGIFMGRAGRVMET